MNKFVVLKQCQSLDEAYNTQPRLESIGFRGDQAEALDFAVARAKHQTNGTLYVAELLTRVQPTVSLSIDPVRSAEDDA